MSEISSALSRVRNRITAAAVRADRDVASVRLLPISKTVPADRLTEAVSAGLTEFGENRVQEAELKSRSLAHLGPRWSLVGHLQTNKAPAAIRFAHEFQALDSLRLAEALDRALQATDRELDVFVQVNTSGESTKFGLAPDEVPGFFRELRAFPRLVPQGLMTLAAFTPDEVVVRACFRRLAALGPAAEDVSGRRMGLSMGMSGDYEIAIEEGATVVRVGQAIFGARATADAEYWPGIAPDRPTGS